MNLAMSFFAAIPWLVKAHPGLLPRGLFALEDALTFSDACWEETQQCPAWRRAQCVYMEEELNLRPRLSQIISLSPKKPLNFKVWPCRKLGSENYMLASSQQTVRAASVVFGGRRSTKESEQTSSSELTHTGDGKTSLFEKQHPPGGRACAQRTLQRLFCKAMVFPKCLVAKSPEITAQEPCAQSRSVKEPGPWCKALSVPTLGLLSKRMLFGAGSWARP